MTEEKIANPHMTEEKIANLQKLAEEVHSQNWRYEPHGQTVWGHGVGGCDMASSEYMVADIRGWGHLQYHSNGAELQDATGKFIAAADPATVLALIDEINKLRDDARRYQWLRDSGWDATSHPDVWVQVTNDYGEEGELDEAIDTAMDRT